MTELLDRPWRLAAQVSVRPEPFGALLYHFGTRRLSFLKDRRLLDVVQRLPNEPTAGDACRAAGLGDGDLPTFTRALQTLASTGMIEERTA